MPNFRKLSTDEIDVLLAKRRSRKAAGQRANVRQQYKDYLQQYRPGDWFVVELEEGESRVTVKNRLQRAARDLGYRLFFLRSRGTIRVQVQEQPQ